MVNTAFDEIRSGVTNNDHDCHRMELKFIKILYVTDDEAKLMPKIALRKLKSAMLKANNRSSEPSGVDEHDEEIVVWLGEGKPMELLSRFRYIYFTEPDLILHTRASAMNAIRSEMDRGGVFTAHRFMPLPHQRSFDEYNNFQKVIPDSGRFADIRELDRDRQSCCDVGNYYPSNPTRPSLPLKSFPCGRLHWWQCGFFQSKQQYNGVAAFAELHHRIPSPLVSLSLGTGWPLIHNNQRVCFPQSHLACDE